MLAAKILLEAPFLHYFIPCFATLSDGGGVAFCTGIMNRAQFGPCSVVSVANKGEMQQQRSCFEGGI